MTMGLSTSGSLILLCILSFASFNDAQAAHKKKYFKYGGNWKSQRDQPLLDDWSKSRTSGARRSSPDLRPVRADTRDVPENTEVELSCTVDRNRYPAVQWARVGQPLPQHARTYDNRLYFRSIQLTDAGTYVCTARNGWDKKEVHIRLNVQPGERIREQVAVIDECRIDQAVCRSGDCIDRNGICDGEIDCRDGSDEHDCAKSIQGNRNPRAFDGPTRDCEPNEFKCNNGKCMQLMWRCDGDDDCGDNSDEQNCGQRLPGELCAPWEFKCHSQSQCIPIAFQCDKRNDCFDGSDEVGCAPPTVVEPPKRDVSVRCGDTIVLTCRTVGVPVPYVNWRLNWGPVCGPPRCTQTSVNGLGTLTIRNAMDIDQGAYTCEAVNVVGRLLVTPDAIVRVDCFQTPPPTPPPTQPLFVTVEPKFQEVDERTVVNFRCIVRGGSGGPFSYTWTRVGYNSLPHNARPSGDTLIIENTQIENYGTYRCTATSPRGESGFDHGELKVRRVGICPYVWIEPDSFWCGPPGSRKEFVCKAIGEPTPRVYWSRIDGRPFDSNVIDHGDGRLVINNVSPKDYGQYICTAENIAGKNIANATVCAGGPPIDQQRITIRIEPTKQIASSRGDTVEVRCIAYGPPPITVSWSREDGRPFPSNVQDSGNGVLRIMNIEDFNSGDYRCTARNPFEQAFDIATIYPPGPPIRRVPPEVDIQPREIVGRPGDSAQFRCTATGDPRDPPPTKEWSMKGGLPLPPDAHVMDDGILSFPNLQQHHDGMYECTATTPFNRGSATAPVRLTASGRPPTTPIVTPPYITAQVGDRVSVHCQSGGDPPPAVRWGYGTADTPLRPGVILADDGTLRIDGVQESDEGVYFCTATNPYGRAVSQPATIRIIKPPTPIEPPRVWITPTDYWTGRPGEDYEFQCHATGDPPPQLSWSREDGVPLGPNAQELGNGILRLTGVTRNEAGRYICTAFSPAGTATAPATVAVEGGGPLQPEVIPPFQQVPEGQPAQFECRAPGYPPPTLTWGFQQERGPLRPGVHHEDGRLYIDRVTKEDAGQYICTATNELGSASAPGELQVVPTVPALKPPVLRIEPDTVWTGEPGQSHTFTCIADDPETVISWQRPDRPLDPNMQDHGDGRLSIDGYQSQNDGEVICKGESPGGSASVPAQIQRADNAPPVPEVTPKIQTIPNGDTAEFECKVDSAIPATLNWAYGSPDGPLRGNARVEQEGKRLVIQNVQQEDEGKYYCIATNPYGSNSAPGTLYVEKASTPPEVTITPQKEWTGKPGEDFTFKCTATGYPEPQVFWTREGGADFDSNIVTDEDGNLIISSARRGNDGRYVCTAKNEEGEDSDTAEVKVEAGGVRAEVWKDGKLADPVIYLAEETSLELECRGTGDPEPEIGWTVDMGPSRGDVPEGYKPVEIFNQFARTDSFSRANEGIYLCNATNEFGTDQAMIRVIAATGGKRDVVILGGSERPTEVGTRLELKCVTSDVGPKYDLRWMRRVEGGDPVAVQHRQTSPGTLVVPEFSREDAGTYLCQAWDQQENAVVSTAEVNVSVFGEQDPAHVVEIEGARVRALRSGDTLELTCTAPAESPSQSQLVWQFLDKGGFRPLTKGSTTDGKLFISNVQLEDAGIYSCVRFIGEDRDGANQVTVLVANSETTPEKKHGDVGYPVELQCPLYRVTGMSYIWKRVNQPRLPAGAHVDGHYLSIPNFKPEHAGTYECEGRLNGVRAKGYVQLLSEGAVKLAAILRPVPPSYKNMNTNKMHERFDQRHQYYYQQEQPSDTHKPQQYKPAVIQATKPYMELAMEVSPDFVFPGQDVIFRCRVDGDPTAQIRWERVNGALPRNALINRNELKIRKVHKRDNGRYVCRATTKIGEMSAHTNLKLGHKISGACV